VKPSDVEALADSMLVSGLTYTAVGHDGPRPLAGGALNTFPSSIAVKPGDVIGLSYNVAPPAKAAVFVVPRESYLFRNGNLGDGESDAFTQSQGCRVNATAVFVPSNTFGLGAVERNKKKGTAKEEALERELREQDSLL
jgi:hypothetical protein